MNTKNNAPSSTILASVTVCGLLALSVAACDSGKPQAGAKATADTAAPAAASAAKSATIAASTSAAPTIARASSAVVAPAPDFALFAGAPAFEGKTKPNAVRGVSFDIPQTWKTYNFAEDDIISVGSNPPATVKYHFWLKFGKDMKKWATAASLTDSEKNEKARYSAGGIEMTLCQHSVFKATSIHPKKVQWVGEAKAGLFGAAKLPGTALEAKDAAGKWTSYCLRVAISDKIALHGAVAWRADRKDSEANGKAVISMVKSFRPEGS